MTKKIALINKKHPFHLTLKLSDLKHSLINKVIVTNIVAIANRLKNDTISEDWTRILDNLIEIKEGSMIKATIIKIS